MVKVLDMFDRFRTNIKVNKKLKQQKKQRAKMNDIGKKNKQLKEHKFKFNKSRFNRLTFKEGENAR